MVVSSLGASVGAPLLHSVSLALDAIVAFSTWGASIFAPAPALCGVHQNKIMMIINIIIVAVDVIIIIETGDSMIIIISLSIYLEYIHCVSWVEC